jgi:serine/threonine-protein kinase
VSGVRAGDVIAGKFQIERVLGEGGMGYVVAARHLQLGQMVALKFMRDEVCTPDFKSRFLREARNTVRLKSKHVSRVLDVGALEGGSPYMVMEYLEGTDLSELLQKRGPFPASDACEYVLQACEAIAEAHGHGIVHRDLKPANLFLTTGTGGEPVVKVLDFGVSKMLDFDFDVTSVSGAPPVYSQSADSVLTKATDLLGSPSYMSPEQIESARNADMRSDVWSLGVILYRLISGKAPFSGATLADLIQRITNGPTPNLRDLRPEIPAGLEHLIARCLERDREKRISVVDLARALAPYAGPNAAPSLERIAILGSALVTAPPADRPRRSTNPSTSGPNPSASGPTPPAWTAAPQPVSGGGVAAPAPTRPPPTPVWLGNLLWIGLFLLVVSTALLVAVKIANPVKNAESAPLQPSVTAVPSPPEPVVQPDPPTESATPPVATTPMASTVPTRTTWKPHVTSRPKPKPDRGEIPATRE